MKVLLVGPYPPPHGGVSVHVAALRRELTGSGVPCRVVNLDPRANEDAACINIRGGLDLARVVFQHARSGFTVHLHTNGHNLKSWLLVLLCGVAGRSSPCKVVTLHSGMLPAYLKHSSPAARALARLAGCLFSWVVCVNQEIRDALTTLGIPPARLALLPAFVAPRVRSGPLPVDLEAWIAGYSPLLSTTLFLRPEYGLDVLVEGIARLRRDYPLLGVVVMGSGDREEADVLLGRRGLRSAVYLAGDVSHEDCVKLIARSDVFVRATRADGDSISVREAASLGVPTVASDLGQRPEGVHLFPSGDVERFVDALRAALHQKQRLVRLDPLDTVRRLIHLYSREEGKARPQGVIAYARLPH